MKTANWVGLALAIGLTGPQTPTGVTTLAENTVARYVAAVGGAPAIAAVVSRVTRGTFENGRGLVTPFVTWVRLPDRAATQIGRQNISAAAGSGRASDGRTGWDKNFVGTGLRDLTRDELAEIRRMADPFRPAHLLTACMTVSIEAAPASDATVIACVSDEGTEHWTFNRRTGLVDRLDVTSRVGRMMTIYYEDYRAADGLTVPFRERIVVPGASVIYTAASVRFNETVGDAVFARPAR